MQEIQGKYLCAKCNFDYTKLKDDRIRLDEFLVNNMREAPMGHLTSIAMYRKITLTPHKESFNYIKELSLKNGIKFPGENTGCFWVLFEKIFFRKKS
jgi:hypothetical protein